MRMQLQFAAQKRKEDLNKRDLHRMKSEKLSDLELETKQKSQHLLEKAYAQRLEQEDEIKHLNEVQIFSGFVKNVMYLIFWY